jgi:hypothetical protein
VAVGHRLDLRGAVLPAQDRLVEATVMDRSVRSMTLDQLFAVGNKHREDNYACGMSKDGVDYITATWVDALVQYQGLNEVVAEALRRRWMLYV